MYRLYSNVELGDNVTIEDFVIIGKPPKGAVDGEFKTVIGDGAVIRSHTVLYAGTVIGSNFQCGHHVMIREHTQIGDDVSVGTSAVIEHHVRVGHRVRMHSQVFVCEFSVLEEEAWLGPNVVLTNAKYPQYPGVKDHLSGVMIRSKAKLGANVTVLPGCELGSNSLIGAGAVVTKNVPASQVWAGNPARYLKSAQGLSYL